MSDYCYRQEFRQRLSELRIHQGISARDMSLSLGLSEGYINKVENGKMLPTMSTFFEIWTLHHKNFLIIRKLLLWKSTLR